MVCHTMRIMRQQVSSQIVFYGHQRRHRPRLLLHHEFFLGPLSKSSLTVGELAARSTHAQTLSEALLKTSHGLRQEQW
jgi:hypothetical protein